MQSPKELAQELFDTLPYTCGEVDEGEFVYAAARRLAAALDAARAQERERIEQALSTIGGLDGVIHLSVASVIVGIRSTTKDRV